MALNQDEEIMILEEEPLPGCSSHPDRPPLLKVIPVKRKSPTDGELATFHKMRLTNRGVEVVRLMHDPAAQVSMPVLNASSMAPLEAIMDNFSNGNNLNGYQALREKEQRGLADLPQLQVESNVDDNSQAMPDSESTENISFDDPGLDLHALYASNGPRTNIEDMFTERDPCLKQKQPTGQWKPSYPVGRGLPGYLASKKYLKTAEALGKADLRRGMKAPSIVDLCLRPRAEPCLCQNPHSEGFTKPIRKLEVDGRPLHDQLFTVVDAKHRKCTCCGRHLVLDWKTLWEHFEKFHCTKATRLLYKHGALMKDPFERARQERLDALIHLTVDGTIFPKYFDEAVFRRVLTLFKEHLGPLPTTKIIIQTLAKKHNETEDSNEKEVIQGVLKDWGASVKSGSTTEQLCSFWEALEIKKKLDEMLKW